VELDPGGIGKGLAADLTTAELLDAGAAGAMVNLGGDLRVRGVPPAGDAWSLDVEHPSDPDRTLRRLALHDGAVATSSRLRRTWVHHGRTQHHIIDPRTGAPVSNPVVAVTAVAGEGWWAEAATKAVLTTGRTTPSPPGALTAAVTDDGTIVLSPELEELAA
jgi:thiamine biosynthesis lipoprotein